MKAFRVLAINPGSTSTKIAVYEDDKPILSETLRHQTEELSQYKTVLDQYNFRKETILNILKEKGFDIKTLDAIVGRGGLLKPIPSGTYKVNQAMLDDLKSGGIVQHASNLGGVIANEIASPLGIPAFIVDPIVVDEFDDLARYSGMAEIQRKSIFHALNQKAVAKRYAREKGVKYEDLNLIVVHMGGGISIGAHNHGRVVDVNNALDGDGPFSPERSGGLPVGELIKLCFSGKYSQDEIMKKIVGRGGLVAYLGTNDGREVEKRIKEGDKQAELVFKAMAYQISKEIGSCAAVLCGKVDAIIMTGGLAYDKILMDLLKERVSFISDIVIYPGEDEALALAEGGLRVLKGEEVARVYA